MSNNIHLKQGLNLPISGVADQKTKKVLVPDVVSLKPSDFRGLVPRLLVKEGDAVLAGSPVFADKMSQNILFTSPVSGVVSEVVRGEKRKLLEIRIKSDKKQEYVDFGVKKVDEMTADQIKTALLESGLWPCLLQRPYGIVANPELKPKAIFTSAFTTAPLAPEVDFAVKGELANIQTAINALSKLTDGGVHVSFSSENACSSPLSRLENIIPHVFEASKHPAGNLGVQIHHISPIRKGETVWTVTMPLLAAIGKLFNKGRYDVMRKVAVTGPMAINPCFIETVPGLRMNEIQEFYGTVADEIRFISGDCLSGRNIGANGALSFMDNQITLLHEGREYEGFGWAKPFRFNQFSSNHTYFHWLLGWLCPNKKYDMDTNLHGGERAFVVSDVYGEVLPMHLFPVYLAKACLAGDIDKMEKYGIYEVLEEDFALCEYVCPSKIDIQAIISEGIDLMLKEMA